MTSENSGPKPVVGKDLPTCSEAPSTAPVDNAPLGEWLDYALGGIAPKIRCSWKLAQFRTAKSGVNHPPTGGSTVLATITPYISPNAWRKAICWNPREMGTGRALRPMAYHLRNRGAPARRFFGAGNLMPRFPKITRPPYRKPNGVNQKPSIIQALLLCTASLSAR